VTDWDKLADVDKAWQSLVGIMTVVEIRESPYCFATRQGWLDRIKKTVREFESTPESEIVSDRTWTFYQNLAEVYAALLRDADREVLKAQGLNLPLQAENLELKDLIRKQNELIELKTKCLLDFEERIRALEDKVNKKKGKT